MNRLFRNAAVVLGVCATAGAVYLALAGVGPVAPDAGPGDVGTVAALGGFAAAMWLLYDHSRADRPDGSIPWSGADRIVDGTPEATPQDRPLSGDELSGALWEAREAAREHREVEAGVAVVRPLLREAYLEVATGDEDREAAEAVLEAGTWTDDRVAAAALSAEVYPPARSLRRRIVDWLYPGRAVTRRVSRAVDAISAVADESLPSVIGQSVPRQIPVYEPSLAVRTVGADGRPRAPGPRSSRLSERPRQRAAADRDPDGTDEREDGDGVRPTHDDGEAP